MSVTKGPTHNPDRKSQSSEIFTKGVPQDGGARRNFGKCGPGAKWGLENCFSKHRYNFGMDELRDPKFSLKDRASKNI